MSWLVHSVGRELEGRNKPSNWIQLLAIIKRPERLAKRQVARDVERQRFERLRHIDALWPGALISDQAHELIDGEAHEVLLLVDGAFGESAGKGSPHLLVGLRVGLAYDRPRPELDCEAAAAVKLALPERLVSGPRPVYVPVRLCAVE